MIIDTNEKCPVCNTHFTPDDDVVFCPKCGTPHHRDCYHAIGHCANADKHSTGFVYKADDAVEDDPDDDTMILTAQEKVELEKHMQSNAQHYYNPQSSTYYNDDAQGEDKSKTLCPQCNAEISKDAPFCSHCGARQNDVKYGEYNPINNMGFHNTEQRQYENSSQTIDGKNIKDVAAVVGTNIQRFIPKFLQNKKISWNWGAFFLVRIIFSSGRCISRALCFFPSVSLLSFL